MYLAPERAKMSAHWSGSNSSALNMRGEILVLEILPVVLLVKLPPDVVRLLVGHAVPVPLGVLLGRAPAGTEYTPQ